mmetsp:Transcript_28519/g.69115  ORF Transcript_28519/g.69115 Transcript_28519/m.69115 type:complete len:107 (+) Transcript_28519:297-617(+)
MTSIRFIHSSRHNMDLRGVMHISIDIERSSTTPIQLMLTPSSQSLCSVLLPFVRMEGKCSGFMLPELFWFLSSTLFVGRRQNEGWYPRQEHILVGVIGSMRHWVCC